MCNAVPTTCFGRFLTGHHQVGIQCQRNYIPTISIDISISVSTNTNTDVYTHSRYIAPMTLYSNLMIASQEKAETCSCTLLYIQI